MAKIAFLSYYSGFIERGVETFNFELSRRLSKKHLVSIFQTGDSIQNSHIRTYTIKSPVTKPVENSGFFSKIYFDKNSLYIFIFTLLCIPKLLKNRYDVIVPLNGGWQIALIRLVSKLTGSKVLVCGQAGIGSDETWNLFFRPDVFVALTTPQKVWAQKLAPEVRIETIPNGVDLARFNTNVKPLNINLKNPIVVCSSALVPYKRVELTIRAVAKANLSLLLLGSGQLKGTSDALGKRLLRENYLRLEVKYSEIEKYYKAGSVFTLVSKTEAFGISYIEAMACNLPVVATNDKSRAEIIGPAGILTDPQNTNQYAKDLITAINNNYRNIPYDQALKFSWNKIAKKYSDLISSLL